jgi:hypothetical protein
VILHRLRRWWQHRPRGAILAFFDVKPIAVKAYGGRCYTRARRLVLQRNQKTRGRFYLFLLYEVNRGRVHWAFFPGKGGKFVRQFLRRVRRWYPRQLVFFPTAHRLAFVASDRQLIVSIDGGGDCYP